MRFCYLVVDGAGGLRQVSRTALVEFWRGRRSAAALGGAAAGELRLVSVARDGRLLPRKVYLLRVPVLEGRFTPVSRLTLLAFTRPACVTPAEAMHHHTAGWPRDFFAQLAVALDVPTASLHVPLGIGGPMLAATVRIAARRLARPDAR